MLPWLQQFRLGRFPWAQRFIARVLLPVDYWRSQTTIVVEGVENLTTGRPTFIAMNHTDRFNYMPFMHRLDQLRLPPAAPWVKGKYYQKAWLARVLNWCNCIPVPSRGYIITLEFKRLNQRPPEPGEYRSLRDLADGKLDRESLSEGPVADFVARLEGDTGKEFFDYFDELFSGLAQEVIRINREALDYGHFPLVFPQGTRSRRLSKGHTGLVQMAHALEAVIVPVGVSGSDRLYPDSKPFSRGGRVLYRVGEPLTPTGPKRPYTPLSLQASQQHGPTFEVMTEQVMDAINGLLEPDYRYSRDKESDGVSGVRRFL